MLLKEGLRRFAECARWCCVDRYVFHMNVIIRLIITDKAPFSDARRAMRTKNSGRAEADFRQRK